MDLMGGEKLPRRSMRAHDVRSALVRSRGHASVFNQTPTGFRASNYVHRGVPVKEGTSAVSNGDKNNHYLLWLPWCTVFMFSSHILDNQAHPILPARLTSQGGSAKPFPRQEQHRTQHPSAARNRSGYTYQALFLVSTNRLEEKQRVPSKSKAQDEMSKCSLHVVYTVCLRSRTRNERPKASIDTHAG